MSISGKRREIRHQIIEAGPEFRFDRVSGQPSQRVPDDAEFKAGVPRPLAPGTSDGPVVRDRHRDTERERPAVIGPEVDGQFFDRVGAPWELGLASSAHRASRRASQNRGHSRSPRPGHSRSRTPTCRRACPARSPTVTIPCCGLEGAAELEARHRAPSRVLSDLKSGWKPPPFKNSGSPWPGRPPFGRCEGSSATLGCGSPFSAASAGMLSIPYRQSGTPSPSSSVTTPYAIHCSVGSTTGGGFETSLRCTSLVSAITQRMSTQG